MLRVLCLSRSSALPVIVSERRAPKRMPSRDWAYVVFCWSDFWASVGLLILSLRRRLASAACNNTSRRMKPPLCSKYRSRTEHYFAFTLLQQRDLLMQGIDLQLQNRGKHRNSSIRSRIAISISREPSTASVFGIFRLGSEDMLPRQRSLLRHPHRTVSFHRLVMNEHNERLCTLVD